MAEQCHSHQREQSSSQRADAPLECRQQTDRANQQGLRNEANECVRVAAMMEEVAERGRGDARVKQVRIGKVGGDDAGEEEDASLRAGRAGRERELGQRRADEGMREVLQGDTRELVGTRRDLEGAKG
jgi:hypothetical protein